MYQAALPEPEPCSALDPCSAPDPARRPAACGAQSLRGLLWAVAESGFTEVFSDDMRATLTLATMKGLPGSSPRALAVVAWASSRSCLDMPAVHSAVLQMVRRLTLTLP